MVGVGFIALILIVGAFLLIWTQMDNARNKPDPTKSPEYQELARQYDDLRATMFEVKELAQDNHDVSPLFSDVILDVFKNHERKELGPNG